MSAAAAAEHISEDEIRRAIKTERAQAELDLLIKDATVGLAHKASVFWMVVATELTEQCDTLRESRARREYIYDKTDDDDVEMLLEPYFKPEIFDDPGKGREGVTEMAVLMVMESELLTLDAWRREQNEAAADAAIQEHISIARGK